MQPKEWKRGRPTWQERSRGRTAFREESADPPCRPEGDVVMKVKGGRLDFLAPHLLRGQLLRPGFVSLSLRMGFAQQMPAWAKLQFTNAGVSAEDLDRVLGRISGLTSW